MMMGDTSKSSDNKIPINSAVFHDFLGNKVSNLHTASEKQVDGQFERISCFDSRNDPSVSEISNQFSGYKRNHSDSDLMGSSREGVPQVTPEHSNVMKMLRNASGGDRPRLSPYDRPLHGAPQNRPVSASFMWQQAARTIAKVPKYERSVSMNVGGGGIHYNPYVGPASPVMYQMPSSRFREGGSCPSVLSQLAADEGSRTGNKGSGILKSFNPGNSLVSERNLSALAPNACNVNPLTCTSEPESSNSPSRHGLTSSSRQMTIIFGGQLHVFDDVHPNKADVIMALAGSNGGSWSTTLPESPARETANRSCLPTRENRTSTTTERSSLPLKYDNIHAYAVTKKGELITKAAGNAGQTVESSLEAKQEA